MHTPEHRAKVDVAFARAASAQASAPEVVGFDIDASRIEELCRGVDRTGEIEPGECEVAA